MQNLIDLARVYPIVSIAVVVTGAVWVLVHSCQKGSKEQYKRSEAALDEHQQQLITCLDKWRCDLQLLATSVDLGRWHDVRYAMQWQTLDIPERVRSALDDQAFAAQSLLDLEQVVKEAKSLAATAVLIDHCHLIHGGQDGQAVTTKLIATDYARAVRLLCLDIERLAEAIILPLAETSSMRTAPAAS